MDPWIHGLTTCLDSSLLQTYLPNNACMAYATLVLRTPYIYYLKIDEMNPVNVNDFGGSLRKDNKNPSL